MSRTKIFYFTTDSKIGGTERMILALLEGLDRNKYEPFLCAIKPGGALLPEAEKLGVKAVTLNAGSRTDLPALCGIIPMLRKEKPGILHTFLFHANIAGRIAGRMCGVPVIISSQRSVDKWRKPWHSALDKWTSGLCNLIISNSEAGRKALIEREKIDPARVITIHNGINAEKFAAAACGADAGAARKAFGFAPGDTVLGIIANLRAVKGHKFLLKAFQNVRRTTPDVRLKLLVVGEGKLEGELKDLADKLGVSNDTVFAGFRDEIPRVLAAIDIFVLPSLWEGFPVSVIEAMASGKPVIASRAGGIPEAIVEGETGLLVPPGDVPALEKAIEALAGSPELAKKMGEAGRKKAGSEFGIEKMISKTEGVYERLTGNRDKH